MDSDGWLVKLSQNILDGLLMVGNTLGIARSLEAALPHLRHAWVGSFRLPGHRSASKSIARSGMGLECGGVFMERL